MVGGFGSAAKRRLGASEVRPFLGGPVTLTYRYHGCELLIGRHPIGPCLGRFGRFSEASSNSVAWEVSLFELQTHMYQHIVQIFKVAGDL